MHTKESLRFISLVKLMGPMFWISICCAVMSTALTLVPLWAVYKITEGLFAKNISSANIVTWILITFSAMLIRWGLMVTSHISAHRGALLLVYKLKMCLTDKMGRLPLSFFSHISASDMRKIIQDDVSALETFLAHVLPDTFSAITLPILGVIMIFVVNVPMAIVSVALLPIALWVQWLFFQRSAEQSRQWGILQLGISQRLSEFIRGIAVIKSFGFFTSSFQQLSQNIRAVIPWMDTYCRDNMFSWVFFSCLLSNNLLLVAPVGAWLCLNGSLGQADWVLCLLVAPVISHPLLRLVFALSEQGQRQASLDRLNKLWCASELMEPKVNVKALHNENALSLCFNQVNYSYDQTPVIHNMSFRTTPSGLTAIVGPSGAGKTTLARLATRQFDCESGEITLGGINLRQWPLDELFNRISMVFQDVHLFNTTVKENLLIAQPTATMEQIVTATKAACAHDFISALPEGYDTRLGERGARLSGGERQRLSIARALLRDAPLLILDEATAYADSQNEWLIQQAISHLCKGRSVLMIAHRLPTIIHADLILVINEGKLVGQGQHAQLLESCDCYRQMWNDYQQDSLRKIH